MADVILQITIPDAYVARVQAAYAKNYGASTKSDIEQTVRLQIKDMVPGSERREAEAAALAAIQDPDDLPPT